MSSNWIDSIVSLDCGEVLGTYQGQVKTVDHSSQTIALCNAYRNGLKCEVPDLTISAMDIKELKILKTPVEASNILKIRSTPEKLTNEDLYSNGLCPSPVKVRDMISNHCSTSNNMDLANGFSASQNGQGQNAIQNGHRSKSVQGKERLTNGHSDATFRTSARYSLSNEECYHLQRTLVPDITAKRKSSTPRKIESNRRHSYHQDCFSAPVDRILDEFDFEKNLALFDKQAVFEEIENSDAEVFKAMNEKPPTKYRHNENVLPTTPVELQQIRVTENGGTKYVTDSGLVIPSITYQQRQRLFSVAENYGFSAERQQEMIGRSASEMVLQLVGGSNRLNPKNSHQRPVVLILCGPHQEGAHGVNCARHLANHNVITTVFVPKTDKLHPSLENELRFYEMTAGTKTSSTKDLPSAPIDMIISAIDSHENPDIQEQQWYKAVQKWANQHRAPILAVDPPMSGSAVQAKWCLGFCLPLNTSQNIGQVYLADLGFPEKVFTDVNITYLSPFGHKFLIPLHIKT